MVSRIAYNSALQKSVVSALFYIGQQQARLPLSEGEVAPGPNRTAAK
jgi:hypothetical protein